MILTSNLSVVVVVVVVVAAAVAVVVVVVVVVGESCDFGIIPELVINADNDCCSFRGIIVACELIVNFDNHCLLLIDSLLGLTSIETSGSNSFKNGMPNGWDHSAMESGNWT